MPFLADFNNIESDLDQGIHFRTKKPGITPGSYQFTGEVAPYLFSTE